MAKRKITPGYVFFYILFLPDTWRLLIGVIAAVYLVPLILAKREFNSSATLMIWIMMITIGWAASGWPGKKISELLKRIILKDPQ